MVWYGMAAAAAARALLGDRQITVVVGRIHSRACTTDKKAVSGNTNEPTKYVANANDKTVKRSSFFAICAFSGKTYTSSDSKMCVNNREHTSIACQ